MIRFALKCDNDHRFESWFQSGSAFDTLQDRALVSCPDCGSTGVAKDLMAPKIADKSRTVEPPQTMVNAPEPDIKDVIRKLRDHVEKNSDYVGQDFASEARAMHEGDIPHRPIYGEVNKSEAKSLIEDGVPAVPLPFIPRQKTN
jgi:hypothetical protein